MMRMSSLITVMSTREKLSQMAEVVKENLTKAQFHQKTWYDKRAQLREFKMGDLVLVLLPTTSNLFIVEHRPGAQNLNTDALSRYPAMALLQENREKV